MNSKYLSVQKTILPENPIHGFNEMQDFIHSQLKKVTEHIIRKEKQDIRDTQTWKTWLYQKKKAA